MFLLIGVSLILCLRLSRLKGPARASSTPNKIQPNHTSRIWPSWGFWVAIAPPHHKFLVKTSFHFLSVSLFSFRLHGPVVYGLKSDVLYLKIANVVSAPEQLFVRGHIYRKIVRFISLFRIPLDYICGNTRKNQFEAESQQCDLSSFKTSRRDGHLGVLFPWKLIYQIEIHYWLCKFAQPDFSSEFLNRLRCGPIVVEDVCDIM